MPNETPQLGDDQFWMDITQYNNLFGAISYMGTQAHFIHARIDSRLVPLIKDDIEAMKVVADLDRLARSIRALSQYRMPDADVIWDQCLNLDGCIPEQGE